MIAKSGVKLKKSIAFLDILNCPNPPVMYTVRIKKENKQFNFLDSHKENSKVVSTTHHGGSS